MTDEARRIYYSPAHWEKMLAAQIEYIKYFRSRPFDCGTTKGYLRHQFLLRSAYGRRDYFETNLNVMQGCSVYKWKREASLLVNDVNYGLMLEGLRRKLHNDIDKNFECAFRFIGFKNAILDAARAMREMTEGFKFPEELLRSPDYVGAARRAGYYRSKLPFPANIIPDTLQAGIDILTPKPELKFEDVFDKDNFSMDPGSPEGDRSVYVFHDANGKRWEVDEKDIDIKHNTDGTANITVYNAHRYGHK
jgi:hypothetical protein